MSDGSSGAGDVNKIEIAFENGLLMTGLVSEDQLKALKEERHGESGPKAKALSQHAVDKGWISKSAALSILRTFCGYDGTQLPTINRDYFRTDKGAGLGFRRRPRIPIWVQLTTTAAVMMATVVLVSSYFILKHQKERLYNQSVMIGAISLNYFANAARIHLLEGNELKLNSLINDVKAVEGLAYALIIDSDGIIRAHSDLDRLGNRYDPVAPTVSRQELGEVSFFTYRLPSGAGILNLEKPVRFKDKLMGFAHVGVSIDSIETSIRQERDSLLMMTLPVIFAGLIITFVMGFWFSDPLFRLVNATQEIGRGNYRHRIELGRNDEFGDLASAFNRMSEELFRNQLMQKSFGKYVGSQVADMILASPGSAWLKGRLCEATILFADIRGFTSYSEGKDPAALVEELNEYFEIATRVIIENGGYVDKFIGDAVLGVFGVPVYSADHRAKGVVAAIEIQRSLSTVGSEKDLLRSVGISVHSGVVVAGNIGSASKMEYTVIGDAVNVASRINAMAGSGDTIISKSVYDGVKALVNVEAMPLQELRGRSEPVAIYRALTLR